MIAATGADKSVVIGMAQWADLSVVIDPALWVRAAVATAAMAAATGVTTKPQQIVKST